MVASAFDQRVEAGVVRQQAWAPSPPNADRPVGSTAEATSSPGRVFSLLTRSLLCTLALALAFGVMHESSEPAVLGRCSAACFALLQALAAMVALLA
jgi:hypothetical protein